MVVPRIRVEAEIWFVILGVLMIAAGVWAGVSVRRYLARKRDQLTADISAALKGARTRKALSKALSRQVNEIIAKRLQIDERVLATTMWAMVQEFDSASKSDDRQSALMNIIAISDKLNSKLAPWYVRHEKLVAAGVSLVGILSGLATAVLNVAKLIKGTP